MRDKPKRLPFRAIDSAYFGRAVWMSSKIKQDTISKIRRRDRISLRIILGACVLCYVLAVVIELSVRRRWLRFLFEASVLAVVTILAIFVSSAGTGRVSFGQGASPLATVGVMFAATSCGIIARYIFYLEKGQFSLLEFLKPFCISPIVLLPLIGSVQATAEVNAMQLVSFVVLAFQNGFFWQAVLMGAKPVTQSSEVLKKGTAAR